MKVITAEQIRDLDRRAMAGDEQEGTGGIPGAVLMENAGCAVVDVMQREYGPLQGKRVAVLCGSGNNGGDGAVSARRLRLLGAQVEVSMVGRLDAMKADAATHWHVMEQQGIGGIGWGYDGPGRSLDWEAERRYDFIVDALLGYGAKGAPKDVYASAIRCINATCCPVISVDIPSGVDADTGATPGEAVRATHTVTFAYPKLGLYLYPGADYVGKLHVEAIGFDWETLNVQTNYRVITIADLRHELEGTRLLLPRRGETNKGDYGHVGIVAGSRGMVGAPALVARGAQRVGAGLVTVLTAASAQSALAIKLDEQMTLGLPEADGSLGEAAFERIAEFAEKASVLCVGPGLTTEPGTVSLVHRLLTEIKKTIILDADGLNALAQNPEVTAQRTKDPHTPLVLTPHPGEAARLLGTSIPDVQSNRLRSVQELARRFHAVAVLKGRHTLIADPAGNVFINTSGNPGMATGGMGDALTGIVGGLLSQWSALFKTDGAKSKAPSVSPLFVVALGVHLHGLAGDIAALKGETGLVAGDVISYLPTALQQLKDLG